MIRVQMIGTQRSGSNLLRLMLDQSGEILGPPSAHELRDLLPLVGSYESLAHPENQARLARDLIGLVELNALPWPEGSLSADRLLRHLTGLSLAHFVLALYDQAAAFTARRGWVSKCLENVYHRETLEKACTEIRYVHIVRDPRDVALSFRRAPIGPKDPRVIAMRWREDQRAALEVERLNPGRTRRQRFEDLVMMPRESLRDLFTWLGIEFSPATLEYHRRSDAAEAAALSPLWSNLDQAPMAERVSAYARDPADRHFLRQVEELLLDDMTKFDYEPVFAPVTRELEPDELARARVEDERLRSETMIRHEHRDQSAHLRRDNYLAGLRLRLANQPEASR